MATDIVHDGEEIRRFKLVRWFALVSLLSIGVISLASSTLLSSYISRTILQRDATVAMEFVNSIVRTQNASSYFYGDTFNPTAPELEVFFGHIANMPDVLRANVYAADRSVLWSSDEEMIGRSFGENKELELAFTGVIAPEIELVRDGGKEEHIDLEGMGTKFVEYYLPIWDMDGNSVVGVVEVYRAPGNLLKTIDQGQRLIWLISLLAGTALFIGLYVIVRYANGVIERQHTRLVKIERLAVIGEMASAVAHGLRNPLAAIRSSAELSIEDEIPSSTRQSLENIVSQSDRLECWIRNFLTTGQVETSKPGQSLSVDALIRDCLDGFSSQLDTNHVNLTLQLDPSVPDVKVDPDELIQAINTVISNSIEAMEDGGELLVASQYDALHNNACIEFSDTGPGIAGEIKSVVFEPFTTTKPTGIGIGLTLARHALERIGGTLELNNRMSGGVSVRMFLPVES